MVSYIKIELDDVGQRLDNYIIRVCKGVPKSRIYRAIRGGEVRVNKKRVKPHYRLQEGDQLRLPPLNVAQRPQAKSVPDWMERSMLGAIVYEDNYMMLIDKPSGMAVHGGQSESLGVVEALRLVRPDCRVLELAHRLDRGTSGCLVLAKKRAYLRGIHQKLRDRKVKKQYLALVKGRVSATRVTLPLLKTHLPSGERIVKVSMDQGKEAISSFKPLMHLKNATLVSVQIKTGRTHQIRVHAARSGFPLAGDDKYGCPKFNRFLKEAGLNRLFLHAAGIDCRDELTESGVYLGLPLPKPLELLLKKIQ